MTLALYLFAPDIPDDVTPISSPTSRIAKIGAETAEDIQNDAHTNAAVAREQALIARIQQGDADAFRDVYLEHYPILHDIARTIVGAADVADDTVQQVFMELWNRRAVWNPHRLRPALIHAVRFRALDHWRRGRKFDGLDALAMVPAADHTDASAERRELDRALADALAALPERRRTALLLRAVRQWSYAEIGEALDISEKAAFILVARTRATLEPIRRRFEEF